MKALIGVSLILIVLAFLTNTNGMQFEHPGFVLGAITSVLIVAVNLIDNWIG